MALTITPMTVTVHAFGEMREVNARLFRWEDERTGKVSERIDTDPVFAARFPTGTKIWKADACIRQIGDSSVYELVSRRRTLINSATAWIFGWYDPDKHDSRKSRHNSAL